MNHPPNSKLRARLATRTARVLIIALLIALPTGAGAAVAVASSGDTSAIAVNTRDGSSVFRLTFAINNVAGSSVTNQNAAVAYASCTACQTVAISIQVLLISGSPTTFTPTNIAIAINQNCDLCDTLAAAYQFAVGVDTKLKFTAAGRQQIADIRHQLEMLRHSGLTGPQTDTQVNGLMTQLGNTLQTQLVGVNQPASSSTNGGSPNATPADTSTTPTATSTNPTNATSTSGPAGSTTSTPTTATSTTTTTPTTTTTTPTTTATTSTTSTPTSAAPTSTTAPATTTTS